jgi:hypothetical protein
MGNMNGDPDHSDPPRAGVGCKQGPKVYAVVVTDGGRSIRYEAPTMEEAKRMAGMDDLVANPAEFVTLTEAKQ